MSLLFDAPPTKVQIDGTDYPINWDFRTGMKFENLLQTEKEPVKVLLTALKLFYPITPPDVKQAFERILWFYRCGDEPDETKSHPIGQSHKVQYSYDEDGGYIYAAFIDQYGIDLQTANLHWWQFRPMFKSLRDDQEIVKIIGYRSIKIDSKMSATQKTFYKKMKKQYALKCNETHIPNVEQYNQQMLAYVDRRFRDANKK